VCVCDTCKVNNEFLLALFPMYGEAISKFFLIPRPRPAFHCLQYGSTAVLQAIESYASLRLASSHLVHVGGMSLVDEI